MSHTNLTDKSTFSHAKHQGALVARTPIVHFPITLIGTQAKMSIFLENHQSHDIVVRIPCPESPFFLKGGKNSTHVEVFLQGNSSVPLPVKFHPEKPGEFSHILIIQSTDMSLSTQVQLRGKSSENCLVHEQVVVINAVGEPSPLKLINISSSPVYFKAKTSSACYFVLRHSGFIDAKSEVKLEITYLPKGDPSLKPGAVTISTEEGNVVIPILKKIRVAN